MRGGGHGRTLPALVVATAVAATVLASGCVDLFHDTDFTTACSKSPPGPECRTAVVDAALDAAHEAAVDAGPVVVDLCSFDAVEARRQALRACAWVGACAGTLGDASFGRCTVHAQLAMDCTANPAMRPGGSAAAMWTCLAAVRSCADVDGCLFGGTPPTCPAVTGASLTTCGVVSGKNDGARVECAPPGNARATVAEACALSGRRCTRQGTASATCTGSLGFGTCTVSTCEGSRAVDCAVAPSGGTVDVGLDCASRGGGRCIDGVAGPLCAAGAAAPACTEADPAIRCVDGKATQCVDGKAIVVDCQALGLPCNATSPLPTYDPSAACDARGAETCTGADGCVDDVLTSCGRGVTHSVDCKAAGLGPCRFAGGQTDHASCTPP